MKSLQTVLGDHQDAVITRDRLRDLAVQAFLAGENAFTYGLLHEREDARIRELQDEAWRVWEKASAGRQHRWLR